MMIHQPPAASSASLASVRRQMANIGFSGATAMSRGGHTSRINWSGNMKDMRSMSSLFSALVEPWVRFCRDHELQSRGVR